MIKDSTKLIKGQILKIEINMVKDRISLDLLKVITDYPKGKLVGFKMVDGNQFGLVLKLNDSSIIWFFEHELSTMDDEESLH